MSVPSQCADDGRCSRCARSIAIGFCLAINGARIAARVMMMTMPIPIRARLSRRNLCRCLGSSISPHLLWSSGWISQLGWRVRRLTPPSAMLPEVLRGHRAHPFLQMLRETSNDCIDIAVAIASLRRLDSLDHDSIPPIRLAQRDDEYDRHVESQGEYRRASRSLCRPSKEGNEGRCETHDALVGHERH